MLNRRAVWPGGIRWLAGIAVVVLVLAIVWVLFVPLSDWLAHHDVGSVAGPLHETAVDNARGRLLTLGAGLFAAGALVFTARNFTLSRRTLELTEQGQVTDRYTKAIEQLGSDKLDVRIGGIYALERVARDSFTDHPTVMEVLTAFIREHSREPWPPSDPGGQERERSTRPDIQAAVTVVGRRERQRDLPERRIDLTRAVLAGAVLPYANLDRALLAAADLSGAVLIGANLAYAYLDRAVLTGANLTYADPERAPYVGTILVRGGLTAAVLSGAVLTAAHLDRAQLSGADLTGADLTGADLTGADLTYANLTGANLGGANLTDANLTGAVLADASLGRANLTDANLTEANLTGAELIRANLTRADLPRAVLAGVDFTAARLDRAVVADVDLTGALLAGVDLTTTHLGRMDVTDADLTGARWPSHVPVPEGWELDTGSDRLKRARAGSGPAAPA
jgi:uncharacterized protein YjbI with pentapeptide repeats